MSELRTEDAPKWHDWLTDFDKTHNLFTENVKGLIAVGPYIRDQHPELLPRYDELMTEAKEHKATLDRLKSVRRTVIGWLNSISEGLSDWREDFRRRWGLDGLGAVFTLPFAITVASASAALAAIGKWISDTYIFSRRLNELQRLEAGGLSPKAAAEVVDKSLGPAEESFLGIKQSTIRWVVIGGLAIMIVPPMLRYFRRR